MAKMRNVGIILAVVTIILFGTQCRHEAVETDVERSVNPGAVFSPMKSVVGSFDIVIDTDSFTWSSARSPMTNRLYNVNNVGPIGTFILYTDGSWELLEMEDELHWYGIPFDPENDSFFDALEWGSIPSVITNFLANEDMVADVPLTVTFPAFVDNAGVYAAYTMGIRVSGNGVELLWSGMR